jgi:hypothetical protein
MCRGELVRLGRATILRNVTNFSVAPDLDDEEGPEGPVFES